VIDALAKKLDCKSKRSKAGCCKKV
jgi:hypothetical protein